MTELTLDQTAIPGLLILQVPVDGDNRGWFKENWQRTKMTALGLPDFQPVQNNVSFNATVGVTRGFHAEPWDKLVSVTTGRVFGAWVDLRDTVTFGTLVTVEVGPGRCVFVPRGVANAFQTLEPGTVYSYLVNDHWSAEAKESYTFVNLGDPTLAVAWPIPLEAAELSGADRAHPQLENVTPMASRRTMIIGGNGQLGRALAAQMPGADAASRDRVDLTDPASLAAVNWRAYDVVINAAAHTAVDGAETPKGRREAWEINVTGVRRLVDVAREHRLTLVHVSSDYVFDGTVEMHDEDEAFSPLGVYGQTKAAGDALVATLAKHYITRTSWVIGDGRNFVQTMVDLGRRGVSPRVVDDQHGRLTFTADLAEAIQHLVVTDAPYGTYNVTGDGDVQTWADVAAEVFRLTGAPGAVTRVSTEEYADGRSLAPRPSHSALDLTKIKATGFLPTPAAQRLAAYVSGA